MEKIAIFVDVQNIYYTVKDGLSGQFDYNTFWSRVVKENVNVAKAFAYAIDRSDQKQIQFQNILRGIGFNVKLRPYISRKDGSAKGDFDLLVDKLISMGKTVDVYGVPLLTADSLVKSASRFVPIDQSFLVQRKSF
jgi:uncharacterized LabA/DUF88 family protein